jgi:hypothetical protein
MLTQASLVIGFVPAQYVSSTCFPVESKQLTIRVINPVLPHVTEQPPQGPDLYAYELHGPALHDCPVVGLGPALLQNMSPTVPPLLAWQTTTRVCVDAPHVAAQPPQAEYAHAYAMQSFVVQDLLDAGLSPEQLNPSASPPDWISWQTTCLVTIPAPHVTEHARHAEYAHEYCGQELAVQLWMLAGLTPRHLLESACPPSDARQYTFLVTVPEPHVTEHTLHASYLQE